MTFFAGIAKQALVGCLEKKQQPLLFLNMLCYSARSFGMYTAYSAQAPWRFDSQKLLAKTAPFH